jgi:uncharacterized protein (TIGR00255 family)
MTGYGKAAASGKHLSVEVEIKSINSRFLEVYLKLPPTLATYEFEIREILRNKIKRGKINVVIQLKKNGMENGQGLIDKSKLDNFLKVLNEVRKSAKIKDPVKLEHILFNKDILAQSESQFSNSDFNLVKTAVENAAKNFFRMKAKEGGELLKDLTKRIKSIDLKLTSVEKLFKKSINQNYANLKKRISELISGSEIDENRLSMELAIIADKAEITEECVRLRSHLKFFIESLKNESEPGRKLNFLCQEMNREANTISSKSVSTEIIHKVVLMKEEIEKIREQIQNIE